MSDKLYNHPLIDFVDGPTGRRAHIEGTGADVWEVVATIQNNDGDLEAAADYLSLPLLMVEAANDYYLTFPDEIDERIRLNQKESEQAETDWSQERSMFIEEPELLEAKDKVPPQQPGLVKDADGYL